MSQSTNRRFYCELCKITVPWSKRDITDHNRTQKHQKNKEKDLDFKHNKAKTANMTPKEKYEFYQKKQEKQGGEIQMTSISEHMKDIGQKLDGTDFESKQKRYLQEQRNEWLKSQGQKPEHIIQEKKNEKKPDAKNGNMGVSSQELVMHTMNNIWAIMNDPTTGKMCFFNKISKQKKFEKPFGLKMSEEDKQVWENAKNNQGFIPVFEAPKPEQLGTIGQWQDTTQDYYETHKAPSSPSQHSEEPQFADQIIFQEDDLKLDFLERIVDLEHDDNHESRRDITKTQVLQKMAELEMELQDGTKPIYKRKTEGGSGEPKVFKKRIIQKKQALNLDDD